jgi:hypothetical protein
MLKVGSLVVVGVADGCYSGGGGRKKESDATLRITRSFQTPLVANRFSLSRFRRHPLLPSTLTTVALDVQLKICSCLHPSDILSRRKVCNR